MSASVPKVTKAEVVELAKALSAAEKRASSLGMQNAPTDPVKRVESEAQYRMAKDALNYSAEQYKRAFDAWATGGYQE